MVATTIVMKEVKTRATQERHFLVGLVSFGIDSWLLKVYSYAYGERMCDIMLASRA